jgi:predicted ester cyclase
VARGAARGTRATNTIAVRLFVRGTHTGPLNGPDGTIPATGREVVWDSVDWVKIENGKIASWNVYEDGMAFMAQLGLLPPKK